MNWLAFLFLLSCASPSKSVAIPTENKIIVEESKVVKVGVANFDSEVLQSDRPVVVDFSAKWCGACQNLAPIFEMTARKHPEIKFAMVDVDEEPRLSKYYAIHLIPTLIVFKSGKIYTRSGPVFSEAELLRLLY